MSRQRQKFIWVTDLDSKSTLVVKIPHEENFLASSDAPVGEQVDDLRPLRSAAHHLWATQVQPSSRWTTTTTTQDHTGCHLLSADGTEAASVSHICCHCSLEKKKHNQYNTCLFCCCKGSLMSPTGNKWDSVGARRLNKGSTKKYVQQLQQALANCGLGVIWGLLSFQNWPWSQVNYINSRLL